MADLVCRITWALQRCELLARCDTCGATHTVTDRRLLDAWADAHREAAHPQTARVSVIRVMN